jgi:two-component system LytT family sensor kinase
VVWAILGTVSAIQVVAGMKAEGMHHHWTALFITTLADWLVPAFAAPGVLWLTHSFPVGRGQWRTLPIHIVAAVVLAVAFPAWSAVLEWAFGPLASPRSFSASFIVAMFSRFHIGIVIYAVTVVVSSAIDSIHWLAQRDAEAARLERELTTAQLEGLRRQLEPHFLLNTLNGIAGLVGDNRNDEAVAMTAGLGDLLRRLLEDSGRQLVPLAEEISFLETYMEIQSMRFGASLKVTMDVPHEIYAALVPPLILQPLLENAIMHGAGAQAEGGEIHVMVREAEGRVSIRIRNRGPARLADDAERAGAGIPGMRDRLSALYGGICGLDLRSWEAGVEAILTVPYRIESLDRIEA